MNNEEGSHNKICFIGSLYSQFCSWSIFTHRRRNAGVFILPRLTHSYVLVEKWLSTINCACSFNYCPESNEYASFGLNQIPNVI